MRSIKHPSFLTVRAITFPAIFRATLWYCSNHNVYSLISSAVQTLWCALGDCECTVSKVEGTVRAQNILRNNLPPNFINSFRISSAPAALTDPGREFTWWENVPPLRMRKKKMSEIGKHWRMQCEGIKHCDREKKAIAALQVGNWNGPEGEGWAKIG